MDLGLFLEFPRGEGISEQEAIQESFAIVDEAESLGVDSVWLAEYHFNPGRILSAPITIASAIAARTQHMRVGTAVSVLPLGNPVRIAEEVATLDHISQGRLEFGIGRGTFPNVHEGYNVPFAESRGRFEESLEIILKAWTTERFSFEGEHYQCKDVCSYLNPFSSPIRPSGWALLPPRASPSSGAWATP